MDKRKLLLSLTYDELFTMASQYLYLRPEKIYSFLKWINKDHRRLGKTFQVYYELTDWMVANVNDDFIEAEYVLLRIKTVSNMIVKHNQKVEEYKKLKDKK